MDSVDHYGPGGRCVPPESMQSILSIFKVHWDALAHAIHVVHGGVPNIHSSLGTHEPTRNIERNEILGYTSFD